MKKIIRITLLIIVGAIVIGTFVFLWQKSRPEVISYSIVDPSVRTISKSTLATGRIEPRNEVQIKPQISGIISNIYKEAGEKVSKGDILATIKVIPEMTTLNAAESRVRVANIDYEQAEKDFDRSQSLYDSKVISKEEYEKDSVTFLKYKEEKQNAIDNLEIVKDGIASRSGEFSTTQIRSTINGTILDIPVKVGNSVIQANNFNDGTTIATVADMKDMIFRGEVDESEVGKIHEGMDVVLTIGALQDIDFPAHLEYVSPKGVDKNSAVMFEIKAAALIPDTIMVRAGYSANVEIILDTRKDVLTITESCVEFSSDSSFVYLLDTTITETQSFERIPVSLGMADGVYVEVKQGITQDMKLRGTVQTAAVNSVEVSM